MVTSGTVYHCFTHIIPCDDDDDDDEEEEEFRSILRFQPFHFWGHYYVH